MKKSPNNIDRHVGARLRMRRMLIGMSQEKLGDAIGLTFQQVQKYEKGTNRIGASRLQQIGHVMGVQPAFFFEDMPEAVPAGETGLAEDDSSNLLTFLSSAEGLLLTKAFIRIRDTKVRRKVIDLVSAFADCEEAGEDPGSADEPARPRQRSL